MRLKKEMRAREAASFDMPRDRSPSSTIFSRETSSLANSSELKLKFKTANVRRDSSKCAPFAIKYSAISQPIESTRISLCASIQVTWNVPYSSIRIQKYETTLPELEPLRCVLARTGRCLLRVPTTLCLPRQR